ncbi:hypothetical protein [Klebsiella quasipneumoniae]|uniref:Uncharacterized protein n=1 Tax=Klebsiella quasipneumoniae subsp. quasipneumoniae TaxID=1667327 RepID=A0AAW8XYW2_9ENTR|nr:hypothetical protein [Klebsiella quasipneumoniae]MDV0844686.1 hypothetical protein [Klebsiella quasipneumoniae subsp. quasipneumoniae]
MEIRDQMRMLLEALGKLDAVTRDQLIEQSDLIRAISKKCQSSGLYLDFEPRISQLVDKIEADSKIDDRLMYAWNWCMSVIVSAPSAFLCEGAAILTMPLVAKYLPEPTEPEKPEAIIINLDLDYRAPDGSKTLRQLVSERRAWPSGATCATQDAEGEILYWDAEVEHVKATAGESRRVGFRYQIDAWFADIDNPLLATDWATAVVTPEELDDEYQLDPEWVFSHSGA